MSERIVVENCRIVPPPPGSENLYINFVNNVYYDWERTVTPRWGPHVVWFLALPWYRRWWHNVTGHR